ncbi:MAG: hypothetical protein AB9869_01285 [Verrucomicrobiia bacterium]
MKKALIFLVCILCSWGAKAATVTGTLQPSSGTNRVVAVQILPTSTPQVVGTNFVFSINQTVRTDTNGAFSLEMLQGNYRLVIAGKDTVNIVVPDSTNTFNFIDIIDPSLTNYVYRTPGALVRVSTNDSTWGFLTEKLTNGAYITLTTLNAGSNEVLSVNTTGLALSSHEHNATNITSGTLDAARLPTHGHDATNITSGTLDSARLPGTIPLLTVNTLTTSAQRTSQGTLTHAGTVTLDFATNTVNSLSLAGDVTFATTNLGAGRLYRLLLTATATNDAFTFPAWRFVGPKPTNILADKLGLLSLEAWGADDTNVVARYLEEP